MKSLRFSWLMAFAITLCGISANAQSVSTETDTVPIANAVIAEDGDFIDRLAAELASQISQSPVKVVIQNFTDTQGLPNRFTCSARKDFEVALSKNPKFAIIERQEQTTLEWEKKQVESNRIRKELNKPALQPDTDALIKGEYSSGKKEVTLYTKLTWVGKEGTRDVSSKVTISKEEITRKYGDNSLAVQDVKGSKDNVKFVESSLKVRQDFIINLFIKQNKMVFVDGDPIAYRLITERDCHIAIFDFAPDGSTRVLFPEENDNTLVKAGQIVDIPGVRPDSKGNMVKDDVEFIIGEPYGVDIVVVIACTELSQLHKQIKEISKDAESIDKIANPEQKKEKYDGMRGIIRKKVNAAQKEPNGLWSMATAKITTYPNPNKPANEGDGTR